MSDFTDDQISEYENKIREENWEKEPLVSPRLPISVLLEEFKNSQFECADALEKQYKEYRTCRRDGNCFFRAYLTGFLEYSRGLDKGQFSLLVNKIEKACELFDAVGFEKIVYEDFLEYFLEKFVNLNSSIEDIVQDPESSNTMVVFLRLWTSAYLRLNSEKFEPFLEGLQMREYCERFVESFGKESEHVQCVALCESTGVGIEIVCFEVKQLSKVVIEEPKMILLYRPGHYDVLY